MRAFRLSLQFVALAMLFLFIACTSTKFSAVWKDEAYQERPGKILVINAFKNPAGRRLFEDEFAKELRGRKVDAVVSYTIMPDPIVFDKDAIAALARDVGADTVLINRALEVTTGETDAAAVPGFNYIGTTSYEDVYIKTQTDVYDMRSNRLISSATAKTWIRQGIPYSTIIKSYVKDLVKKLSQQGVF
jgi:hypothetical protein